MISVKHFQDLVIVPALKSIDRYSEGAVELLLGTAIQESKLKFMRQLGNGPALGFFQMEPATFNDIWKNYLLHRSDLAGKVAKLSHKFRDPESMTCDLRYAAAMCRVHYLRAPDALPKPGDYEGQAAYWKKYYNTYLGAGTEEEYIDNWYAYGILK